MVAEYLAANLTDREETLYKGILRLPPAHSLLIREGRIDKRVYWDLDPGKEVRHRTDEEYAEHFSSVFKEAVRCRLRSHGPVGAELSGGLDSSSVVVMAQELYREGLAADHDFATLSLVYPGQSYDESSYIDDVVDMWKVESHKLHQEAVSPSVYFEDARRYEDFRIIRTASFRTQSRSSASEMGSGWFLAAEGEMSGSREAFITMLISCAGSTYCPWCVSCAVIGSLAELQPECPPLSSPGALF
jgi:asparagine synthase (glutamine-hydrolysing)